MTSCKKHSDDNTVTPKTTTCPIAYINDDQGDSTVYVYDAQNKLTAFQAFDNTGKKSFEITYAYSSGDITSAGLNGVNPTHIVLNSDGTAKYATSYVSSIGYVEFDTVFYTYDSKGYNIRSITKKTNMSSPRQHSYDTTWNTYTNGNLTYTKTNDAAGTKTASTTAYTTLESKFLYNQNFTSNVYGKASKNLPASNTLSISGPFSYTSTTNLTYQLNASGYITSITSSSGNSTSIYYYHYNCK